MTDSNHQNELPPGQARPTSRFFGRTTLRTPQEALQPDAAPPPPPDDRKRPSQRRPTLSAISGFLSLLMIAAVCGVVMMAIAERKLSAPGPLTTEKVVFIPPRTGGEEVIDQLAAAGVIDEPTLVKATLWLEGRWSQVKAGEYAFKREASLRNVMDTIVSGRQLLHSVTIPEGLTSEQIVQRLRDMDVLAGDIRQIPPEGTLLPETYRVTRGMSRNDLIRKMQLDQTRLVDQVWEKRVANLPLRSKYELVTLASIVEKETGRSDERKRVASVFHNRLNKRMRLQSDPTIVYGLVGGKGTLGRPIQRSEITRATAYNTYVIEGLPPGPIANPGRAALEAVVNPLRTSDLFFVADGTGGHAFAETLDQHNRNVSRWREIERDQRARQDAAPATDRAAPDDGGAAPAPTAAPANSRQRRSEAPASSFGSIGVGAFGAATARGPVGFAFAHWSQTPAPASLVSSSYTQASIALTLLPTTVADMNKASSRAALRAIAVSAPTESAPPATTAFAPMSALADAPSLNFSGFDRTRRTRAATALAAAQAEAEVSGVIMTGDSDEVGDGGAGTMAIVPVSGKRLSDMEARAARFRVSAE